MNSIGSWTLLRATRSPFCVFLLLFAWFHGRARPPFLFVSACSDFWDFGRPGRGSEQARQSGSAPAVPTSRSRPLSHPSLPEVAAEVGARQTVGPQPVARAPAAWIATGIPALHICPLHLPRRASHIRGPCLKRRDAVSGVQVDLRGSTPDDRRHRSRCWQRARGGASTLYSTYRRM